MNTDAQNAERETGKNHEWTERGGRRNPRRWRIEDGRWSSLQALLRPCVAASFAKNLRKRTKLPQIVTRIHSNAATASARGWMIIRRNNLTAASRRRSNARHCIECNQCSRFKVRPTGHRNPFPRLEAWRRTPPVSERPTPERASPVQSDRIGVSGDACCSGSQKETGRCPPGRCKGAAGS